MQAHNRCDTPVAQPAQRVVHDARRQAHSLGHHRVGTEHFSPDIPTIQGRARDRPA